jgi:hypothetical protein
MSYDILGEVGPGVAQDGTRTMPRLGRHKEVIQANLRGEFAEASQRGNIYIGSTPAAGVTVPIYSNTTQQFVLHNPVGNNKRFNLLSVVIGYISGTQVAGHYCLANQTLLTSAITGTAGLIQSGRLQAPGVASGSTGLLYTAATVVAFTYLRALALSQVVQAATATNAPWLAKEDLRGVITVMPGSAIAVAANVAAAVVASIALEWEETELEY